jgi:hypothetical protein
VVQGWNGSRAIYRWLRRVTECIVFHLDLKALSSPSPPWLIQMCLWSMRCKTIRVAGTSQLPLRVDSLSAYCYQWGFPSSSVNSVMKTTWLGSHFLTSIVLTLKNLNKVNMMLKEHSFNTLVDSHVAACCFCIQKALYTGLMQSWFGHNLLSDIRSSTRSGSGSRDVLQHL